MPNKVIFVDSILGEIQPVVVQKRVSGRWSDPRPASPDEVDLLKRFLNFILGKTSDGN